MTQEPVVMQEVRRWTVESEETLRDALSDMDWEMFWESADDVSVFMDVVRSFVATLTDNVIPTAMVKSSLNQNYGSTDPSALHLKSTPPLTTLDCCRVT